MARQLMTRRTLGLSAAAAAICTALPADEWITVAHGGRNRNGRAYSRGNLRDIARDAKGRLVAGSDAETPSLEISLSDALAVVTHSRLTKDMRVQIKVRWFSTAIKRSGYITPNGRATVDQSTGVTRIGKDFRLISFCLNKESAFQRATAVN